MQDRKTYEEDLKRRQEEHLKQIDMGSYSEPGWKPCAHDNCLECLGTGIKKDGSTCIHYISCDCPKCRRITLCVG